jgi:hypothetical protein
MRESGDDDECKSVSLLGLVTALSKCSNPMSWVDALKQS